MSGFNLKAPKLESYGKALNNYVDRLNLRDEIARKKKQQEIDNNMAKDKYNISKGLYDMQKEEHDMKPVFYIDNATNKPSISTRGKYNESMGKMITDDVYKSLIPKPNKFVYKIGVNGNEQEYEVDPVTDKRINSSVYQYKKSIPKKPKYVYGDDNKIYIQGDDNALYDPDTGAQIKTKPTKKVSAFESSNANTDGFSQIVSGVMDSINQGFGFDIDKSQQGAIASAILSELEKADPKRVSLYKVSPQSFIDDFGGNESAMMKKLGFEGSLWDKINPLGKSGYIPTDKTKAERLAQNEMESEGLTKDTFNILRNTGRWTDKQLLENLGLNKTKLSKQISDYLKTKHGYDDGKIDRFLKGIEKNGNGLFANYGDVFMKGTGFSEELRNKNKKLEENSKNFSVANNEADIANVAGEITGYAPELLLKESKALSLLGKMISNGIKFGASSYALDKAYDKDNALENGLVAGGIASGATGLLGLVSKMVKSTNSGQEFAKKYASRKNGDFVDTEIVQEIMKDPKLLRSVFYEYTRNQKKLPNLNPQLELK